MISITNLYNINMEFEMLFTYDSSYSIVMSSRYAN